MSTKLFLLLVILHPSNIDSEMVQVKEAKERCPTWYQLNSLGQCKCGYTLGGRILCKSNMRIEVFSWQCMGYDNSSKITVIGKCPYAKGCYNKKYFIEQPSNEIELNKFNCGWLNRSGLLCSTCSDESLGVAVLSYGYACTKCLGSFHGWLLYFTLTLVPITLFFLIVIFCNIRATAAHMNALICIGQIGMFTVNFQPSTIMNSQNYSYLVKLLVTITGIWNLDFFRYIYPPFCISTKYSTLKVISFEYIIAFYPLILVISTYIGIELYDRDYKLLKAAWMPFKLCLIFVQRHFNADINTNAKSNVINALATFITLAYSNTLCKLCYF